VNTSSIVRADVDIETTGLDRYRDEVTVVGICLERDRTREVVQLYDDTLSRRNVLGAVREADILYSYNGARFDLPFIEQYLGVDLARHFDHCDLMRHCWNRKIRGGLKAVERKLGISRKTKGVDGYMAVQLWWDYKDNGSRRALRKLLKYNAEDVTNLAHIRRKLGVQ
jgi:uncharacterized protein YprB with RNaseH-like and TPR domain